MRKAWSHLPLILLLSLALLPGVMSESGNGRTPVDLTTRSGINRYLRSLGVDPSEAVIQRGAHNYAGPNCPGSAWTCAPGSGVIVQLAGHHHDDDDDDDDDGDNVFVCSPKKDQGAGTDEDTNTCIIVQESERGKNKAVCRERNEQEEGTIFQTCSITQVNVSGRNEATVEQSVVMEHDDTTQRSVQRSRVFQYNATGSNRAEVSQRSTLATESEEDEDADVTQTQDVLQESVVIQKTGCTAPGAPVPVCPEGPPFLGVPNAGENRAEIFQSHRLEAEVEESASAEQLQNTDAPELETECIHNPNVCSVADQDSTDGKLRIDVLQVQRHVAEAEEVEGLVRQQQGSGRMTGGMEAINHQDSTGVARRSKVQDERQFVDADDTGAVTQEQFTGSGPRLNSNQEVHEDNFAAGIQNVVQMASDPTLQQATLDAFAGFASGQVVFRQFARQNDATEQQTVTGTGFVAARIECNQGGVEQPEDPCFATQGGD